jgi:hypothetical protein
MILYMRTARTGVRRAALTAAALVVVLGAWWLSEGTPSLEGSKEAAPRATAPAAQQLHVPPPGPAPLVEPLTAAAAPPAPPGSAVTAISPMRDEAAPPPPVLLREPQLPSTSKRDEDEPEN